MDREELRNKARVWRRRAEREHGADRDRSLKLAQSYDALALNPDHDGAEETPPQRST